jgi:hypothetical protein
MTRARDLSNDQANLGGSVAPFVGGKNFLVNGGMDFNQRGGAAVSAVNAYCLDRWYVSGFGSGANNSFGQIGTGDSASNFKNYLRYGQGTGTASTNFFLSQSLETINVIPLQGKQVTFSFWYRTATAFTSTWQAQIVTSTSTDQNINNLYIGGTVTVASGVIANSSTWRYAQVSGTVPSNATSLAVGFVTTGNVVANATFDVTGCQLEIGGIATPFSRAGGSIGGELALCQRYYYRVYGPDIGQYNAIPLTGFVSSSTNVWLPIQMPVTMRIRPSALEYSNVGFYVFRTGGNFQGGTWSINNSSSYVTCLVYTTSGLTVNDIGIANNAIAGTNTSYLALTAEL